MTAGRPRNTPASTPSAPFWIEGSRVRIRVRLTPKGGRESIDGFQDTPDGPALKARVRAAPEDGAANAALERLVADWVGIPPRDVRLASGHKSRVKTIALTGDTAELNTRLAALMAALRAEQGAST